MNRLLYLFPALCLLAACSSQPDYVLSKSRMADLLVDVHRGESIIELNPRDYATDSAKQAIKQSVLAAHGVTQEQLDSSLMWYGHHIEDYMEVYDIVTGRLESEMREMEIADNTGSNQIEMDGDSIDVWSTSRLHRFFPRQPSDAISFTLRRDNHWEKGDIYVWDMRLTGNASSPVRWSMSAEYPDNTVTVASGTLNGIGRHTMTLPTDSAQLPRVIHGYIEYAPIPGATSLYTDSISLTRIRLGHRGAPSAVIPPRRYSTITTPPSQSR